MPLFALGTLIASAAAAAPAPPASSPPAACEARLAGYDRRATMAERRYALDLRAPGGGRLRYLGAEHSTDPAHAQFAAIEAAFAELSPTVVFYEGPARPVPEERERAIRETGESGFVRHLAARAGVPVARLEPDPRAEAAHVLEAFPAEQVELFYKLREAARLRERRGLDEAGIVAALAKLDARAAELGLPFALRTPEALQAAYARHFREPAEWWRAPGRWFTPDPADAARSGGGFFHAVNRRSSEFRDLNMLRVLSAAALRGERVLAVVGRDHVAMQADALACALGTAPARSGPAANVGRALP